MATFAEPAKRTTWPLVRVASGIEAGVIGGVAMLGVLITGSLWRGHVWWEQGTQASPGSPDSWTESPPPVAEKPNLSSMVATGSKSP